MNTDMLHALADSHVQEMRRDSRDRHLAALAHQSQATRTAHRGPHAGLRTGMRTRVGYTLIEAGLRLVATTGPRG